MISQEFPEKGFPPNVNLYNKLIYHLGEAGQIEEASKTFKRMSDEGCHPDTETYNIVINLVGSVGKVDLAYQLFQQMKEKGCHPNLQTYSIMVGLLVHAGRSELSNRVCREMVSVHIEPQEGVLRILQAHEDASGELVNTYLDMLKGDRSASIIKDAS